MSVPSGSVQRMVVSTRHEVLAELFRSQPSLAVELLSGSFRLEVPEYELVELSSGELPKVVPGEFRADAVVLLRSRGVPVLGVVVEVQLSPNKKKHWAWPWYLISLRTRFKCEVALLVVCPSASVAAWCAKPIRLGPNWTLTPFVLGPEQVPVVTDPTWLGSTRT